MSGSERGRGRRKEGQRRCVDRSHSQNRLRKSLSSYSYRGKRAEEGKTGTSSRDRERKERIVLISSVEAEREHKSEEQN